MGVTIGIMEEAIGELHNAVHLALSLTPRDVGLGGDLLQNNGVVSNESSSSAESRISSLSGSLIEQSQRSSSTLNRIKLSLYNNSTGDGNGLASSSMWQRHCLGAAKNVEQALSNYEMALLNVHNGDGGEPIYFINSEDDSNQTSVVDLLVAVVTSVSRHLIQQCDKHASGMMGSTSSSYLHFISAIEQICFSAVCISANMLMKMFCHSDDFGPDIPLIEDRHVREMIEEVAVANENETLSQFVEPIVTLVNAVMERQRIVSCTNNEEEELFSNLSAKDCLLLAASLMQRFICNRSRGSTEVEISSHINLFISSMLEHFRIVLAQEGRSHFDEWADVSSKYLESNLNDDEMSNTLALVSQFHVVGIESALALLENFEKMTESCGDNLGNDAVDSLIAAVQDTIRANMTVVSTTETMEGLGIHQDPQIKVIFDPLLATFATFIVSTLDKAIDVLRKVNCSHEIEAIRNIADDLLVRMCCTANGIEFFKSGRTGEEEEILAVVLLRAMNAGCIHSKAKVLLYLAADISTEVCRDKRSETSEASSKRQKFNSLSFGNNKASSSCTIPNYASNKSMIDTILCCLSLSQQNRGGTAIEQSHVEEVSSITTALMNSNGSNNASNNSDAMVVDPLNPWHSLQLKPLMQLVEDENSSSERDELNPILDSLVSYTSVLRPHVDICSAVLK